MSTATEHFESWRAVVGFEALYEVSDHGRVRRIGRAAQNGKGRGGGARIGRILTPLENKGHLKVQLWKDGKMYPRLIHRLVAEAFIGPLAPGVVVNHIDGVKPNNHVSNLERTTHGGNLAHAYRTGLHVSVKGERHPKAKLTAELVADIRRRYAAGGVTLRSLGAEHGMGHKTIHAIVSRRTWKEVA